MVALRLRMSPWVVSLACLAALTVIAHAAAYEPEADLPAFGASASVQAERRAWADMCLAPATPDAKEACALQPLVDATAAHYKTLDRVFVLVWNGIGMNGLGNSLEHYLVPLVTGALADRASFQLRNKPECNATSDCAVIDPGDFIGAAFGAGGGSVDWRWSEALAAELRGRGVAETVLEFDDTAAGFVERATGLRLPGAVDMLTLLSHPEVAPKPWVRVELIDGPKRPVVDKLWEEADRLPIWTGFVTERLNKAVAARLAGDATPQCDVNLRRKCLAGVWLRPRAAFQRALLPHVARLDAARAAGGIAVGIHVRTGYADHAASGSSQVAKAVTVTPGSTAAERRAAQWTALDDLYPPQCRDADEAALDTAGAALCAKWAGPAPAALATHGASCAINATNATAPAFAFAPGELRPDAGLMTTLLTCAANWAASGGPASAPWMLYVAGDLPPLFLLANSSASLAGHVDTADGSLGHVSFSRVCTVTPGTGEHVCAERGADPGGAWTRAMVDWYMLGACDGMMRLGSSSFPSAIHTRVFWPQAHNEFFFSIHPKAVLQDFRHGFDQGVDELTAELNAELHPPTASPPPPAVENATVPSPPGGEQKRYELFPGECLVAQSATWGLGSQLIHLLHAMVHVPSDLLYWDFGPSPYTCCREGQPCVNNGWRLFFAGDEPVSVPGQTMEVAQHFAERTIQFTSPHTNATVSCKRWWTLSLASLTQGRYNASAMCPDALCGAMRRLWQPSAELQAVIDYELNNLALYPPPLVALQVRGGDKLGSEVAPYTLDAGIAALAANASLHNGTCVVLGDDDALGRNASALARAALGCVVVSRIHPGHAHVQRQFAAEPPGVRCQRTKQLLVDVEIMARAQALAALAVSNTARIGALLRACRQGGLRNTVDWQLRDMLAEACRPN